MGVHALLYVPVCTQPQTVPNEHIRDTPHSTELQPYSHTNMKTVEQTDNITLFPLTMGMPRAP